MVGSKITVSLLAPGPVKTQIFREPPSESSAGFHQFMTALLDQNGLGADQFAPLVFDAIERGDYLIMPQPELLEPAFSQRNQAILSGRQPGHFSMEEQAK
jgi:short-subunit dehydrogenase